MPLNRHQQPEYMKLRESALMKRFGIIRDLLVLNHISPINPKEEFFYDSNSTRERRKLVTEKCLYYSEFMKSDFFTKRKDYDLIEDIHIVQIWKALKEWFWFFRCGKLKDPGTNKKKNVQISLQEFVRVGKIFGVSKNVWNHFASEIGYVEEDEVED
jgi:hypothetical protein